MLRDFVWVYMSGNVATNNQFSFLPNDLLMNKLYQWNTDGVRFKNKKKTFFTVHGKYTYKLFLSPYKEVSRFCQFNFKNNYTSKVYTLIFCLFCFVNIYSVAVRQHFRIKICFCLPSFKHRNVIFTILLFKVSQRFKKTPVINSESLKITSTILAINLNL